MTVARTAFLRLGFRPFFTGAAVFAVVSMLIWTGVYVFGWQGIGPGLPPVVWHAHEMVFGYSLAVIAGFLLTAVQNWTGVRTLHGLPLLLLFLLWIAARMLMWPGEVVPWQLTALVDNAFIGLLFLAVLRPVVKARQWKQFGILSKLLLLLAANLLFYAGLSQAFPQGLRAGLYSGLYLVMALVFVMGRRVIPFFIEKGVGYPVSPRNRQWLDISSLVLFVVFWIADILRPDTLPVALLAALLCLLHAIRMFDWHTRGIWTKPLLWVLYLGYGFLACGFALKAAVPTFGVSPLLAVHAFAYGGIGMISMGMMARVTLGHTGRNVLAPPPLLSWMFSVLLAGAILRILPPLFDTAHYRLWIGGSQMLWILAFSLFIYLYLPMLAQPRVDGKSG